jgi:hypothetical protein
VVAVSDEEHVMFSSAEYWNNGKQRWLVSHAGDLGCDHKRWLIEKGELPPSYEETKSRLILEQEEAGDEVDYIHSMPLELAETMTGFNYDKGMKADFEVLKLLKQKSWLRRFFTGA